MRYLIDSEYASFIQAYNFTAALTNTTIDLCEAIAVEEAKTYIRQRYNVDLDFRPVLVWNVANQYKGLDRVAYNGAVMVFPSPQPIYDNNKTYAIGSQVYVYGFGVYTSLKATIGNYITDSNYWVFVNNPQYAANTIPTLLDDRNLQSILHIVHISLFNLIPRIAPRNIPQSFLDGYDRAIVWLKQIARGEITVSMTLLQPESGKRIVWGSDSKDNLDYRY